MQLVLLSLCAGINMAFAFLSLSVFGKNMAQKLYLYFGLFSFFSGTYFFLTALSNALHVDLEWIIIFSAAVYYAIFPWFLFEFIEKQHKRSLWLLSSIFALAFICYLVIPKDGKIALWQVVAHVGLVGLMITSIYACLQFARRMDRRPGELIFLCLIFVFLGLEEIITTYTGRSLLKIDSIGVLPLDIFPLLFSILMGVRMSSDLIRKKELEVQQISNELNQRKLELAELEGTRLKSEIEFKKKDLTFFGIELNRHIEYIESTIQKMNDLKKSDSIKQNDLDEIIRFAKSQLTIDRNLGYFRENIEMVNHEFISQLKERFPTLTEKEVHLSSLLRLRLSSKEIATIKNVSPDSVKVLRYRLRKKLNLDKNTNLIQFFQDF